MPQVNPALVLPLAEKTKNGQHRMIRVAFEAGRDFQNQNYNLVIDADWYSREQTVQVNGRSIDFDISQVMKQGGMEEVQAVYIDNSVGTGTLSLRVSGTGQVVSCPAGKQGWFPVIAAADSGKMEVGFSDKFNHGGVVTPSWYAAAQITGGLFPLPSAYTPKIFFTDLAVPPCLWSGRSETGVWRYGDTTFGTTGDTVLSTPRGTPRMGVGFKADPTNFGLINIGYLNELEVTIYYLWELLPGEELIITGRECPHQTLYGQSATTGNRCMFYELI